VLAQGTFPSVAGGTISASVPATGLKVGGSAQPDTVLATASVDAAGNFTLTADPSGSAIAAAISAAASNGGWLNIDLSAVGKGNSLYQSISRHLVGGRWQGSVSDSNVVAKSAFVRPVSLSGVKSFAAAVPGCRPYDQLSDEGNTNTTIGELHTGDNQTAWFRYGQSADSDVEVGVGGVGSGWSVSGTAHVGNDQSAYVQWNEGAQWGYKLRSNFHYQKFYRSWIPAGCGGSNYYIVKASSWNTGMALGDNVHDLDNHCSTSPYTQGYLPNSDFQRVSSNATWFSGAFSAFGFSARAQSGFSSYVISHWHHGSAYPTYYHCGSDAQPNTAHRVYSGW